MSENKQERNLATLGHGKLYRALSTVAYVGVFAAFAIMIFSIVLKWNMNAYLWGAVASIAILSLGIISALPWVRRIEKKEFKLASLVFAIFIAVCVVLWLICLWLIVNIIGTQNADSAAWFAQFLKITIIVSLQLMVSTFVGNVVIKCGKTMIAIQVISYLSYAFVDFYISYLLFCVNIDPLASSPINVNTSALGVLGKPFMIALFVLALVYCLISNAIIKSIENRRVKAMAEELVLKAQEQNQSQQTVNINLVGAQQAPAAEQKDVRAKLADLKQLKEDGLITEEEYNKKRDDILKQL